MFYLSNIISRRALRYALQCRRVISVSPVLRDNRTLVKLKKLQAHYQVEDGRPIWLKAGFRDRFLYSLTIVLCVAGLLNVFITIFEHAQPPSWKNPGPC